MVAGGGGASFVSDAKTFGFTFALHDAFSKPLAAAKKGWNAMTDSVVKGGKKAQTTFRSLGDKIHRFTSYVNENTKSLQSFVKTLSAIALTGGAAIIGGVIAGLGALLLYGIRLEHQIAQLATVTDASNGSMARMTTTARNMSMAYGESMEETLKMVSAIAEIRPVMAKGTMSFNEFVSASQAYGYSIGQNGEAVAGLFSKMEKLGMSSHGIRRLGDAMKYWADTTGLTNSEMMSLVESTEGILKMLPKGARETAGVELTGLAGVFKGVLGDPGDLMEMFKKMDNVLEANPLRDFVAKGLTGGMDELQRLLGAGDYRSIMKAMASSAQHFDRNLIRTLGPELENFTGINAESMLALSQLNAEAIDSMMNTDRMKGSVERANKRRMDTLMHRWEVLKQKFLEVVARVSGPLTNFLTKIMKPLEDVLMGVANSMNSFVTSLDKTSGGNTGWLEQLSVAAGKFWEALSSNATIHSWWDKLIKAIKEYEWGDFDRWLGEKILGPSIRQGFVYALLGGSSLSPQEQAAQDIATAINNVPRDADARKQIILLRDTIKSIGQGGARGPMMQEEVIVNARRDKVITQDEVMGTKDKPGLISSGLAAMLRRAGIRDNAMDTAAEWTLILMMMDLMAATGHSGID
jgi:hypothetical protein